MTSPWSDAGARPLQGLNTVVFKSKYLAVSIETPGLVHCSWGWGRVYRPSLDPLVYKRGEAQIREESHPGGRGEEGARLGAEPL